MRSRPGSALPTELPEREVLRAGLEPATTSSWTRTGAVPARSDPQCAGGIRTRVPELPQAREDGRSSTALRDGPFHYRKIGSGECASCTVGNSAAATGVPRAGPSDVLGVRLGSASPLLVGDGQQKGRPGG